MEIYFTAGEVAKMSGVTKQMLIYYDNEGIFSPHIKGENGYRYYTHQQLEVLDSILILRELGVPLKEIKAHMENPTVESTTQLLKKQHMLIQDKIKHLTVLKKRVEKKTDTLKDLSLPINSFRIVNLPKEYLASQRVKKDGNLLDLDIAIKFLLKKCSQKQYVHSYQIGSISPYKCIKNGDFAKYTYAFLPLDKKEKGEDIIEKPAGLYGEILYQGSYESVGTGYSLLRKYALENGYECISDGYEYSVTDSLTGKNNQEYITKIQMMLKKL